MKKIILALLVVPGAVRANDDSGDFNAILQLSLRELLLENVRVTAQKRSERLLDVPMSVAAITAAELTNAGIRSTGELQQLVPGLTTVNNGLGFVPVIRGISSQGTSPGDESNVAIYVDDVYLGAPMAGLFDLADVERIEVLKGPQGTLFGRNATGGAIRIATRKPSFEPHANIDVDYGFDYAESNSNAFVTGPLAENLAASFSAAYRAGDGYIDGAGPNEGRQYGDPDNYLVRGKLLFRPQGDLEVLLAADSQKQKNDTIATVWAPAGAVPYPGAIASQPFKYAGSTQPIQQLDSKGISLDAKWTGAALTVRSITAYRDMEVEYQADLDRTNLPIAAINLAQYQKNLSQEINVSSDSDAIHWLAGLYGYGAEAGNPHWTTFAGDAGSASPSKSFTNDVDTRSYAGFGDITWDAASNLHLTAGLRYTRETKDYQYRDLLGASTKIKDKATWESPTARGVVRYDLGADSNIYLSLSNGFKSGVYDAYSSQATPVDPEQLTAVEIGGKTRFNDFTFTAAVYDYDYNDIQVSSFASVNGVLLLSLSNAASAEMRGLEFSIVGPLTPNLLFNAGINWTESAEFKDFKTAQVIQPIPGASGPVIAQVVAPFDASGSEIPRTPEWTGNLGLTHIAPLFHGELRSSVSAYFNSGFYWQAGNYTEEPSYEMIGMRFAWTDASGQFTYSLWGTNLTDADSNLYRVPNVRGDSRVATQGRQIGIGVGFKY